MAEIYKKNGWELRQCEEEGCENYGVWRAYAGKVLCDDHARPLFLIWLERVKKGDITPLAVVVGIGLALFAGVSYIATHI